MRFERRLKTTAYHWSANVHIIPLLERAGDWILDHLDQLPGAITCSDAFKDAVSISCSSLDLGRDRDDRGTSDDMRAGSNVDQAPQWHSQPHIEQIPAVITYHPPDAVRNCGRLSADRFTGPDPCLQHQAFHSQTRTHPGVSVAERLSHRYV